MHAHLARVIGEQKLTRSLVWRLERLEVRIERHLRVDDDVLAAGERDDDVGPQPAIVVCRDRALLFEVAAIEHAGELDDALQLELAPAAADTGPLERVDQARGLRAEVLPRRVQRAQPLDELRAVFRAAPLGVLDLAVHLVQRLRHRRQQLFDGLLARVDVRGGFGPRLLQARFGEMQERLIVGAQRLGAERLERFAKTTFGLLIGLEPLGMDGAIAVELRLETGLGRTRGKQSDQRAYRDANEQDTDQNNGVYGH